MPPQRGETTLMSVAADVHFFFSAPTQQPLHHRFQKTSYMYIYHDSAQRQARLEIANAPGTPEQDATAGALSVANISSSSSRPSFLSITLQTDAKTDSSHWKLPAYDLRNERKYLYPLQSLDIYFFMPQDTQDFLNALKSTSSPVQTPATQQEAPRDSLGSGANKSEDSNDGTSTVVQKLEKLATGTPYQYALHGPGSPRAPGPATEPPTSAAYAPLAYNPVAPAKPEAITYRERTPPPPTEEATNVGGRAGIFSQGVPYSPQQQQRPSGSFFSPQQLYSPSAPPQLQHSYASPPPTQPLQQPAPTFPFPGPPRMNSIPASPPVGAPHSPLPSVSPYPGVEYIPASPHPTPSYASVPQNPPPPQIQAQQQQHATHPSYTPTQVPSFQPPPMQSPHPQAPQSPSSNTFPRTPTTPYSQSTFPASPPPPPPSSGTPYPAHLSQQPLPQPQSQSQYQKSQPQYLQPQQTQSLQSPHTIHTHVYRPTEAEAAGSSATAGVGFRNGQTTSDPNQKPGKLEQRADRLEKGVNRFLKRLDGRF